MGDTMPHDIAYIVIAAQIGNPEKLPGCKLDLNVEGTSATQAGDVRPELLHTFHRDIGTAHHALLAGMEKDNNGWQIHEIKLEVGGRVSHSPPQLGQLSELHWDDFINSIVNIHHDNVANRAEWLEKLVF